MFVAATVFNGALDVSLTALPYSAAKTIATTAIATMMQVTRQFFIFPNPKRSAQTIVSVICRFVHLAGHHATGLAVTVPRPVFELDIARSSVRGFDSPCLSRGCSAISIRAC